MLYVFGSAPKVYCKLFPPSNGLDAVRVAHTPLAGPCILYSNTPLLILRRVGMVPNRAPGVTVHFPPSGFWPRSLARSFFMRNPASRRMLGPWTVPSFFVVVFFFLFFQVLIVPKRWFSHPPPRGSPVFFILSLPTHPLARSRVGASRLCPGSCPGFSQTKPTGGCAAFMGRQKKKTSCLLAG